MKQVNNLERPACQHYTLNVTAFLFYTVSRDQKVNIQAPRGGARDPYFMCSQPNPPLHHHLQRKLDFLLCGVGSFCDRVLLWGEKNAFLISAALFSRNTSRSEKRVSFLCFFWGWGGGVSVTVRQHGVKARATPYSCARRP